MAISRKREAPFGISRTETRVTTRRYAVVRGGGVEEGWSWDRFNRRAKVQNYTKVRTCAEFVRERERVVWFEGRRGCVRTMCISEHV